MVHRLFGHRLELETPNSQSSDLTTAALTSRFSPPLVGEVGSVEEEEDDEVGMGSRMNGLVEPSREQQRVIEARRQRNDRISQLMGGYLLRGYKMLNEYCPVCSTILMEDRQENRYCIACEEVDNVPSANEQPQRAALAEISLEDSANLYRVAEVQQSVGGDDSNHVGTAVNVGKTVRRPLVDKATFACASTAPKTWSSSAAGDSSVADAVRAVETKLKWATHKLRTTQNVKESSELVELMRSCAEMIARFDNA